MRIRLCSWLVVCSVTLSTFGLIANAQDVAESSPFADPASRPYEVAEANTVAPEAPSFQQQLDTMRAELFHLKSTPATPKYPTVEVHGVFQADTGWFHQTPNNITTLHDLQILEGVPAASANGDIRDGSDFRRARLSANGAVLPNMKYFFQMDFAFPGRPTFTDVWMELNEVPLLGNVRVGQWKQPFSLEVVSSFRFTTFPERSVLFQAFAPFRHIALGFYDWSEDERMTWAASVYRSGQDQFGGSIADAGGYAGVGRITALPYWEDEGRRYLHTGVAYNYVTPPNHTAQFRTIPEYFIGAQAGTTLGTAGLATPTAFNGTPFFVDTLPQKINHYSLLGTELLWVEGPFSWQTEGQFLWANRTNGKQAYFPGFYSQVGLFLTGEHRPYNRKQGAIDMIQVKRPVGRSNNSCDEWGWGGWELAARFSYIDLNSDDITGGRLKDMTLGLSWYLNNYAKIQFNYIRAFLDSPTHGDSTCDIFGLRAQLFF